LRSSEKEQKMIIMRIQPLLIAALLALPATPAAAEQMKMTIYGDDKCPADAICVRAPERDRYRIPQNLRKRTLTPDSQSWSVRSQAAMEAGKTGTGSCSAVGAGGWTGCWLEQMKQAREEAKAGNPE
jgi:hypothetical protein